MRITALMHSRGAQLGRQPEIKQNHAAAPRDEDVAGLDISVKLARSVQTGDALGELQESAAQSRKPL